MAITSYIGSKTALKTYLKQRLGEGVVRVEVTDDHIEHCINLAIEKFVEAADDGSSLRFKTIAVTGGTSEYIMDTDVYSIKQVFDGGENFSSLNAVFPGRYIADSYGANLTTAGGLFTLEVTRQKIEELNFHLQVKPSFDYNTTSRQLYLFEAPAANANYGILYYKKMDYSDTTSPIYDHSWIKRYATELLREQWGVSLTKHEGTILPSGLQLNPSAMLQKSDTEKEKLETELYEQWVLPIDYMIG